MFDYNEICEINALCEENELFSKYVEKFKEENERLLSKVTHELGNYLTLINSTSQLMESQNPEIQQIKYWKQLRSDIENMKELFLSFSKYNAYEDTLQYKETDIVELVDDIVESFQVVAKEKNITLTMEEAPLDEEIIYYLCDSVKIKQVIVNLLKNAIEAVEKDGTIFVRILGKEETKSYFKIQIVNDGPLIEANKMETIFHLNVSDKGEKRGVGLPLARQIVEAHKGKIEVCSKEANGKRETKFSVCLPV